MNFENETFVKSIQESFLSLLNNYLPKDLLQKAESKQSIKILSIGCGRFREAKSVFGYFKNKSTNIKLYGIEIDDELYKLACGDPTLQEHKNSVFLKKGDATKLENYKDWVNGGRFDLIIVRHPEITFNTDPFIKIFSLCVNLLNKKGYLFATTHFENEKEMLKLLLKLCNFNVFVEAKNQLSPSMEINGKIRYADKYLLIANNGITLNV